MKEAAHPGRQANGKFLPGSRSTGGIPYAGEVSRIRSYMYKRADEKTFNQLWDRIIQLAMQDDDKKEALRACQYLLDRYCGKPAQEVSLSVTNDTPDSDRQSKAELILQRLEANAGATYVG